MNINNNTDISSIVNESLSRLNLNTSNRSYKAGGGKENNVTIESNGEKLAIDDTLKTDSRGSSALKANVDVEEIRKYASLAGEELSIEDINYGLMYGRSVIADYSA